MVCRSCCIGEAWGQELRQSGQIPEGHFGAGSEALWEVQKVSIRVASHVTRVWFHGGDYWVISGLAFHTCGFIEHGPLPPPLLVFFAFETFPPSLLFLSLKEKIEIKTFSFSWRHKQLLRKHVALWDKVILHRHMRLTLTLEWTWWLSNKKTNSVLERAQLPT